MQHDLRNKRHPTFKVRLPRKFPAEARKRAETARISRSTKAQCALRGSAPKARLLEVAFPCPRQAKAPAFYRRGCARGCKKCNSPPPILRESPGPAAAIALRSKISKTIC